MFVPFGHSVPGIAVLQGRTSPGGHPRRDAVKIRAVFLSLSWGVSLSQDQHEESDAVAAPKSCLRACPSLSQDTSR